MMAVMITWAKVRGHLLPQNFINYFFVEIFLKINHCFLLRLTPSSFYDCLLHFELCAHASPCNALPLPAAPSSL